MKSQTQILAALVIVISLGIALLLNQVYRDSTHYRETERLMDKANIIYTFWSEKGIEDIARLREVANLSDKETLSRDGDSFRLAINAEYEIFFGKFVGFSVTAQKHK